MLAFGAISHKCIVRVLQHFFVIAGQSRLIWLAFMYDVPLVSLTKIKRCGRSRTHLGGECGRRAGNTCGSSNNSGRYKRRLHLDQKK